MPLSCSCGYDDYEYEYLSPSDYDTATERLECCSCFAVILPGAMIATFEVLNYDENGEEQYENDQHMCEVCADLYFSLEELGFCIDLGDNMRDLVEEYAAMVKDGELE